MRIVPIGEGPPLSMERLNNERNGQREMDEKSGIDRIYERIKSHGWESLTEDERSRLRAASDGGDAGATLQLGWTCVSGIGEVGWEDRKRRALELFAKARSQGFPYFGDDECAGLGFLERMEQDAAFLRRYCERHPEEVVQDAVRSDNGEL